MKLKNKEIEKEIEDSNTYHFFFNHGIYDELFHYQDLITETELFIKSKLATMENSIDDKVLDERFGKKMQYEGIFPLVLWKSMFLSTYFLLEYSLDQICKNLKKSNSLYIELKDISGNGIFRSSLYLKKVCGILDPFQTESWKDVTNFNKIRNVFVHTDGIINKFNIEIIKVCEMYSQINTIKYDEDNMIIYIDSEFCRYSLAKIEKVLQDVHEDMQKLRDRH